MMNKKKSQTLSLNIISIACIALLVLIVISIASYEYFDKFNPETDVCDSGDCITEEEYDILMYICDNNVGLSDESLHLCYVMQESYQNQKWHPKNKCELNPEAEGCVCDEYEQILDGYSVSNLSYELECERIYLLEHFNFTGDSFYSYLIENNIRMDDANKIRDDMVDCYRVPVYINGKCLKSHLPPEPIEIDLEEEKCVEWTDENNAISVVKSPWEDRYESCSELKEEISEWYDKYCCIKKEPKNECEKNNPDYILDNEVCRLKELKDYSCKEIKKSYSLNIPVMSCYNIDWIKGCKEGYQDVLSPLNKCCHTYTKEQIYDEIHSRCKSEIYYSLYIDPTQAQINCTLRYGKEIKSLENWTTGWIINISEIPYTRIKNITSYPNYDSMEMEIIT